jgi:hypothetical protein
MLKAACLAAALLVLVSAGGDTPDNDPSWEFALLSDTGLMMPGWWRVDIYRNGRLKIAREGEETTRWSTISNEALGRIRRSAQREELTALDTHYGNTCVDCPMCMLMVRDGARPHWVTIARPDPETTPAVRRDMARVLRVIDVLKEEVGASGWSDSCR